MTGGRLETGYDPTDKGFYHGGDLKGVIDKLDYIQDLGTTAIWLTPSFKNKPVQGDAGANVSAGYHGYWITDFTQIDPHLGTNADLKTLIDRAHATGMKVFFDIITNHTADVIDYTDGPSQRRLQESVHLEGGRALYRRRRQRRSTTATTPTATSSRSWSRHVLPVHAGVPHRGRQDGQGAGLAQRPDDVPQPRRLDLRRREQRLWRLRRARPGRPVDRAARGRRRDDEDLPDLGRGPGHRRLPHRHGQAREHGVLAALRPGAAGATPRTPGNDDFFMFGEVYDADPRFMSPAT